MKKEVRKATDKNVGKKIPRATFSGTLEIGDTSLPCYILEDGRRIFSTKGMIESLGYKGNANANEIFSNKTLTPEGFLFCKIFNSHALIITVRLLHASKLFRGVQFTQARRLFLIKVHLAAIIGNKRLYSPGVAFFVRGGLSTNQSGFCCPG